MPGAGTSQSGLLASMAQCSEQECLLNCCSVQGVDVMPKVPPILMVEKHNRGTAFLHLLGFACPLQRTPEGDTRVTCGARHQDGWEVLLRQLLVGTQTRQLQHTGRCHDCLAERHWQLDMQLQREHTHVLHHARLSGVAPLLMLVLSQGEPIVSDMAEEVQKWHPQHSR